MRAWLAGAALLLALTNLIIGLKAGETPRSDDPYDVVDMPLYYGGARLVDSQLLFAAARAGRWVNVWTVNDPANMDRMLDLQVDAVITNRRMRGLAPSEYLAR